MPATVTTAEVWREVEKRFCGVLGFVTPRGEARTAGIGYAVKDRNVYIVTGQNSWKVRHILANPHVSFTVTIPKRVPFMPWIPVPPATISFQGEASIHDLGEVPPEIPKKLLRGLKPNAEELAKICIIKIRPVGEFLTYGVGVSMQTMRKPEAASGRAPLSDAISERDAILLALFKPVGIELLQRSLCRPNWFSLAVFWSLSSVC